MERFWSKVDIKEKDDCWPWKAGTNNANYGMFWSETRMVLAHRMAWILTYKNTPPEGQMVLHRCNNERCCNPNHLYIGNASDNMKDRGRSYGKTGGRQKIINTEGDICKIIGLIANGKTQREVAKIMGVSQWNIWNILNSVEI